MRCICTTLIQPLESDGCFIQLWNHVSIPRVCFILWFVMSMSLRTRDKLVQMGVIDENVCLMCNATPESIDHPFFQCAFSMQCLQVIEQW